jgi:hypothetical protein
MRRFLAALSFATLLAPSFAHAGAPTTVKAQIARDVRAHDRSLKLSARDVQTVYVNGKSGTFDAMATQPRGGTYSPAAMMRVTGKFDASKVPATISNVVVKEF